MEIDISEFFKEEYEIDDTNKYVDEDSSHYDTEIENLRYIIKSDS